MTKSTLMRRFLLPLMLFLQSASAIFWNLIGRNPLMISTMPLKSSIGPGPPKYMPWSTMYASSSPPKRSPWVYTRSRLASPCTTSGRITMQNGSQNSPSQSSLIQSSMPLAGSMARTSKRGHYMTNFGAHSPIDTDVK